MGHRAAHRRPTARLALLGAATIVALTAAPAATSFAIAATAAAGPDRATTHAAAAARVATPAADATSPGAAPGRTTIHGWRAGPARATAGRVLRLHLRVTGARRVVHLERRLHHRWHVVDTARSGGHGHVVLAWRAPRASTRVAIRVHVVRTADLRATTSEPRVIVVRAAAGPQPARSAAPPTTPAPAPAATPAPTAPAPTTTSAPVPAPTASTPTPLPADAAEALRGRLFTLVDEARAQPRTCGSTAYPAAPPLARSDALDRAAGDYAAAMATGDFFSHEGPDGSTMVTRLQAVGIRNTTMRENIAAGQTSAESVMQAWLASAGHCANLMSADVTRIGLGHAADADSTYRVYWVQDFAG